MLLMNFSTRAVLFILMTLAQILIISSKSLFLIWVGLELKMFFLLALMYQSSQSHSFFILNYRKLLVVIWYFLMQVIGSFLMVIGMLNNSLTFILLIGLLLKIGFYPLFYWVVFLYSSLTWSDIFITGYLSKVGLFFLFMNFVKTSGQLKKIIFLVFILTYFFSLMGIFNHVKNLKILAGWSSLKNFSLLFLLSGFDLMLSSFLFCIYGLVFFFFCHVMYMKNWHFLIQIMKYFNSSFFFSQFLIFSLLFLWFVGLPPFVMFWVKVIMIEYLSPQMDVWFFFGLSLLIFFQILVYLKIFGYLWFNFSMEYWLSFNKFLSLLIFIMVIISQILIFVI